MDAPSGSAAGDADRRSTDSRYDMDQAPIGWCSTPPSLHRSRHRAEELPSAASSPEWGGGRLGAAEPAQVALTFGQADAVEVFADGDGVFPGGAQQVAELGHGHGGAIGEPLGDAAAELGLD